MAVFPVALKAERYDKEAAFDVFPLNVELLTLTEPPDALSPIELVAMLEAAIVRLPDD